ncbi:hypothetical protein jhhlp_008657 [Lomentospora prolificans]|uniref:Uncharacterized protein n=1 Tax=Lomentospora prolificans TaxID=41688 RepID=A0A2N3MYP9_9PEZI|nr:hypothetical protein jhhlp_008657 [Lomentospora prolificans]
MSPPGNAAAAAAAPPPTAPVKRRKFFDWVGRTVRKVTGSLLNPVAKVSKFLVGALGQFTKLIKQNALEGSREPKEIENPQTAKEFEQNLNIIIQKSGLDDFYKPGDKFLERVAAKAEKLKDDPNNSLKRPDEIKSLVRLALYQPVLYCGTYDDSSHTDHPPC